MDFSNAAKIAQNIYWVGELLENDAFQCLPYLIESGDESILVNPGSMMEFELELHFLTTPYCHSPGAFVSYEPKTKVLFSSDIFGGIYEKS